MYIICHKKSQYNHNQLLTITIFIYNFQKVNASVARMYSDSGSGSQRLHSEKPAVKIFEFLSQSRGEGGSRDQTSSDLILRCSDGVVAAHQLVLASISPVLHAEFRLNKFDEVISISAPDVSSHAMSRYLDAVYQCGDLSCYEDISSMLGFRFANSSPVHKVPDIRDNGNHGEIIRPYPAPAENTDSLSDEEEENFDAADLLDTDMKEEVNSDEENFAAEFGGYKSKSFNGSDGYKEEVKAEIKPSVKEKHRRKSPKFSSGCGERRKRSKVWDNFTPDPADPLASVCNSCQEVVRVKSVKYRTQTLEVHLRYCRSGIPQPASGSRPKRSKVWKYYHVDTANPAQCVCQICQESVSYNNQGTSTMIKHLQIAHAIVLETIARKSSPTKRAYKVKLKKEPVLDPETGLIKKNAPSEVRKKRRKEVWQHFESFPQDNSRAQCKICHQVIEMKAHSVTIDLVKHLNSHDIKLELETCSVCGKTFDERVKRRHHEKMHYINKTHSCQHCGKMFRDNSAKLRHERTHTGEKPYQVKTFIKTFIY